MYWPYKCLIKSSRDQIQVYCATGFGYYDEADVPFDHSVHP